MGKNTVVQNIALVKKKKHHGFLSWRFISTKIENIIWNRSTFTHNKLFVQPYAKGALCLPKTGREKNCRRGR
jgi:hypothetical protein